MEVWSPEKTPRRRSKGGRRWRCGRRSIRVAGDDVVGLNGGVVAGEDVREDDLLVTYYERS